MSTALSSLLSAPLNTSLLVFLVALWLWQWNARVGAESGWAELSMSFRKIVLERQYYRVLTAAVTHLSAMHLAFTAASLASLAPLEAARGSAFYARTTALLLAGSAAVWMGLTFLALSVV